MNMRRIADVELINVLTARGYVVRRAIDSRRQLVVELVDPQPGWQAAALEAIRGKLTEADLSFEVVQTNADIDLHRAALRIL